MARGKSKNSSSNNSANIGFEAKLWLAADKLCSNMDAAEYKHVVLRLIFRGIEADLGEEQADTFRRDLHPDLRADFGNANFAWVQHFIYHLGSRWVSSIATDRGTTILFCNNFVTVFALRS